MIIEGTVKMSQFGELYALFVKYDGIWMNAPEDFRGTVHFELQVQDEDGAAFKSELCRIQNVELVKPTLMQKIKNFFN
jgi:hypothetical protein